MAFIIDKQTLNDLCIFGKRGGESVYALFNTTHTRGGSILLEKMFRNPLADSKEISKRSEVIGYFAQTKTKFPFKGELFDAIEQYLGNTDTRSRILAENDTLQRKLKSYMGADTEYELLHKGILAVIQLVYQLHDLMESTELSKCTAWQKELEEINTLLTAGELDWIYTENNAKKLDYAKSADYDLVLRDIFRERMMKLLEWVYTLDVYISIAETAVQHHFSFAQVVDTQQNKIHIERMFHPLLRNPIGNNLDISPERNFIFLTGANMAGKSTFMKTFGICIFLAHMGFPVPAAKMEFSVQNGMYTTINLPDNLNMGYSHFYAEVLRVKKVAQEVAHSQHLVVIFDELFRGTNVKDAYDATVAVSEAFAKNHNSTFMISTHITEAGEELQKQCQNMHFVYLPTKLEGSRPIYTYKLATGITADRHGMMIINNEKIIDILKKE